jgi:hypothetical protein
VLKSAQIPPSVVFTIDNWQADKKACLNRIFDSLGSGPWIVRSSCGLEDTGAVSNAGSFLSILNVSVKEMSRSIERVIHSYGAASQSDEVLIQPMLTDVVRSGVAFSHDPSTCAPYRVVNWSEGADTSAVTSGIGGRVWQQAALSPKPPPSSLLPIVKLLHELLELFDRSPIDCEFAVTNSVVGDGRKEVLWLLQARPLILSRAPEPEAEQAARLQSVESKLERGMQSHPFLMGSRTLYGVMPDWNPAEIIGIRPKALSLSLYRELVTDSIWAYQRHNYGYRNLRSFPLMPHFFGLPYIDVRLSLNSFIPNDLKDTLADHLVDYYMDRLLEEPTLHDKIEFEVVFSCYTLDLPHRLGHLRNAGFSKRDCEALTDSLRNLTNRILHTENGLWHRDAAKLRVLKSRRQMLLSSNADPLARIYWLLEDAKRYGTLPFAGLARAGFISVQLLKSLVAIGLFSVADYEAFLASISSITGQLTHDRSVLDKATFLARYGHLRPGTYNIESHRYDESPERYFEWEDQPVKSGQGDSFSATPTQLSEISSLLKAHDLKPKASELLDFMKAAIELREMAKFYFTQNLSDALSLIIKVGEQYEISREDLAYCDISVFKELHIAAANTSSILLSSIEQGKELHVQALRTSLPPLISEPQDVWAFEWPEALPTFISHKQVTALVAEPDFHGELAGKIVCIPNADPGFDWLFAHPLAGLITAWGGPNSHMAIRAGELGLPAVIGTGEVLYRRLSSAKRLHIDCSDQRVEVLV